MAARWWMLPASQPQCGEASGEVGCVVGCQKGQLLCGTAGPGLLDSPDFSRVAANPCCL